MYDLIATYDSIIIMTFIPWKQWRPLQPAKKLTLINKQISYMERFKTVVLEDFVDEDKGIVKLGLPERSTSNPYSDMTLNEFLTKHHVW
jgi:hypothetical protein